MNNKAFSFTKTVADSEIVLGDSNDVTIAILKELLRELVNRPGEPDALAVYELESQISEHEQGVK